MKTNKLILVSLISMFSFVPLFGHALECWQNDPALGELSVVLCQSGKQWGQMGNILQANADACSKQEGDTLHAIGDTLQDAASACANLPPVSSLNQHSGNSAKCELLYRATFSSIWVEVTNALINIRAGINCPLK